MPERQDRDMKKQDPFPKGCRCSSPASQLALWAPDMRTTNDDVDLSRREQVRHHGQVFRLKRGLQR